MITSIKTQIEDAVTVPLEEDIRDHCRLVATVVSVRVLRPVRRAHFPLHRGITSGNHQRIYNLVSYHS